MDWVHTFSFTSLFLLRKNTFFFHSLKAATAVSQYWIPRGLFLLGEEASAGAGCFVQGSLLKKDVRSPISLNSAWTDNRTQFLFQDSFQLTQSITELLFSPGLSLSPQLYLNSR